MKSNLNFSFLKHKKDGFKSLEERLPIQSLTRSSAWSYSYDLNVNERWEAAMNLEKKSNELETDAEDVSNLQPNSNEDLDSDFLFQGNTQLQELASTAQIWIPERVSGDEILNNVTLLRLSDVQKQRSWLERITTPFQDDIKCGVKPANKRRCKSQIDIPLVDYLWQFVQKTALPLMQKYEQLRQRYLREKREWIKHIEFLERKISVGKSMLRDVDRAWRDAVKDLLSLQKILSQTIGLKVNFKRSLPAPSELGRTYDSNLEAKVIREPQNTLENEFVNLKPDVYRGIEYLELKRKIIEYENLIFSDNYPNINMTLNAAGTRNLQRTLPLEPLQRQRSGEYKNTIVSDSPKNLKVGNTVFVNVNGKRMLVPDIVECSNDENSMLFAELDVNRTKVLSSVKSSASTDLQVGGRKTARDEATDNVHNLKEASIDWWSKQDIYKFKEKSLPKTAFIAPHVLALNDSWYLKNQVETMSSRNRQVKQEDKGKSLINAPNMSKSSTYQTLDSLSQVQRGGEIFNKNISRIPIRSMWL